MDLQFTPEFCAKARALLRQRAAALQPSQPGKQSYLVIAKDVDDGIVSMQWLSHNCDVSSEAAAYEQAANAYQDAPGRDWVLISLRELKEGKK
jgi:hypothetical protein